MSVLDNYDISVDYINHSITITCLENKPKNKHTLCLCTKEDVCSAINRIAKKDMPIIDGTIAAAVGAFGFYFLMLGYEDLPVDEFLSALDSTADSLLAARPASVNLFWCLNRMYYKALDKSPSTGEMLKALCEEAMRILDELDDIMMCVWPKKRHESGDINIKSEIKDIQIIELLLFICGTDAKNKRQSIHETATALISHFGTLHSLFEADPLEICAGLKKDMTVKSKQKIGVLFSSIPHFYMRYKIRKLNGIAIDTPEKAKDYVQALLYGKTIEHLYLILLDKNKKLLGSVLIGKGTIDTLALYPREFVREALKYRPNVGMAILAHNHPSGSLMPSPDDEAATAKVAEALKVINVQVVDHIIVAGEDYISFAETSTPPFD